MKTHPFTIKKLLALLAVPFFGVAVASNASAWGPERPMYTMASPAESATFNSIKDNPTIGDERDFVRVGQINADVTELGNEVEVLPGHQYLVYVYYHNDASSTYNGPEYNNRGVAFKTRMSTTFPTILKSKESGTVSATITAQNTTPLSVWDEATFVNNTGEKLVLNYVAGSAKIRNDWGTNGSVLPSSLFSEEGTLLGLNALNGVILGCEEYHGVVTYVVEARALSGSVTKTVSTDGKTFSNKATVTPGQEVTFKLTIKNTGDIALTNATIKDSLPKGLTLVSGTTELWANDSTTKDKLSDDIASKGFSLGRLGLGNTVYITYKAKAKEDVDCKGISVTNTATLTYDSEASSGDSRSSSAKVTIKKTQCDEPTPTPTKTPSGSIEKSASLDGKTFTSKVTATPGQEVTFKLTIKNTSEVALTNIIIKDALPEGLTLVSGSAESWLNNSTNKDKVSDSIVSNGIKINNLNVGDILYITYKVKSREDIDCPGVDLTNVATLSYDSKKTSDDGSDRASAEVVVEKTGCDEEPTPAPIPDPDPDPIPDEIVETGPLEITTAIIVALVIAGTGFYLWRSKHTLKSVEDEVSGKKTK